MEIIITLKTDRAAEVYKQICAIGDKRSLTEKTLATAMYKEQEISKNPLTIKITPMVRGIAMKIYHGVDNILMERGLGLKDYNIDVRQ